MLTRVMDDDDHLETNYHCDDDLKRVRIVTFSPPS